MRCICIVIFFSSENEYLIKEKWANKEKCNDTKLLVEAIIPKIDSFIKNIKVVLEQQEPRLFINRKNFTEYFVTSDTFLHMRCYTSNFPPSLIQKGISKIVITGLRAMRVYFHSLGMFFGTRRWSKRFAEYSPGKKFRHVVDYEIYQTTNTSIGPCIENITYNKDAFIKDQLFKVLVI